MKGEKGDNGNNPTNWRQCVWRREDTKNEGLIQVNALDLVIINILHVFDQECTFQKRDSATALKVAYAGNTRVYCNDWRCCGRWYITFNGKECSAPMAIDGVVLSEKSGVHRHHHRHIEGFCENIASGLVKIAVHVGECKSVTTKSFRSSGWQSVSRIMIEEYPHSQTVK